MPQDELKLVTRRHFFRQSGLVGLGSAAAAMLLKDNVYAGTPGLHHPAKAKSVIFLFMAGGPSQLDLFDYKPYLNKYHGRPVCEDIVKGERFAFTKRHPRFVGTPHSFRRFGQSGAELSNLLPRLSTIVDDVTFIKSMRTTQFNHAPAQILMNTGHEIPGRPSMGSWLSYGMRSGNRDLPAFVVLPSGRDLPDGGEACWSCGFLPAVDQGVKLSRQRNPRLAPETRQWRVPNLVDISKEPASVLRMYGAEPGKSSFANNCLVARRLVESGVGFVQLYHRGWDTHGSSIHDDIVGKLPTLCRETDQASVALVRDLKQCGLLDQTIVVWGGEFGRSPGTERHGKSKFLGRDHHPRAFTVWVAGGGFKSGLTYGSTDELGYNVATDPVSVHDLQATILNQMGIDHTRLTYRFQDRDYRLTDTHGQVLRNLV
jgi:hypothetical protein